MKIKSFLENLERLTGRKGRTQLRSQRRALAKYSRMLKEVVIIISNIISNNITMVSLNPLKYSTNISNIFLGSRRLRARETRRAREDIVISKALITKSFDVTEKH
jgi:hypothetical protein